MPDLLQISPTLSSVSMDGADLIIARNSISSEQLVLWARVDAIHSASELKVVRLAYRTLDELRRAAVWIEKLKGPLTIRRWKPHPCNENVPAHLRRAG